VGSDYFMKYARADGSFWSFGRSSSGWAPVSPADAVAKLVLQGNWVNGGPWILTFQAGEQRLFSLTTGLLTQIIDRNGNATLITYDSSNRLATVTSASSQHLYFNYGSTSFPNVVTSVTSDFGLTLSYAYDGQGRLIQVTQPDSTTVSFTYNSQSQITAVTDSNGKLLESHTYDSAGRGLTSSEANGINSVTVSYPQ
jgi:YD repeat-containing protein